MLNVLVAASRTVYIYLSKGTLSEIVVYLLFFNAKWFTWINGIS